MNRSCKRPGLAEDRPRNLQQHLRFDLCRGGMSHAIRPRLSLLLLHGTADLRVRRDRSRPGRPHHGSQ